MNKKEYDHLAGLLAQNVITKENFDKLTSDYDPTDLSEVYEVEVVDKDLIPINNKPVNKNEFSFDFSNFNSLNLQKIIIIGLSIIGMIGTFLPWFRALNFNIPNDSTEKWIIFFIFLVSLLVSLVGKPSDWLNQKPKIITIITGVLATLIAFVAKTNFMSQADNLWIFGNALSLGSGLYIIITCGILIVLTALFGHFIKKRG